MFMSATSSISPCVLRQNNRHREGTVLVRESVPQDGEYADFFRQLFQVLPIATAWLVNVDTYIVSVECTDVLVQWDYG